MTLVRNAALVLLAIFGVLILSLRAGLWNPSYEEIKAKYAGAPSQFIAINGTSVHVRDEGQGPTIVMVHSSMSDLHIWDQVADVLKKNYRVIRFDWPPYGLSIDPTENFGMDRAVALLGGIVDHFKLDKFVIIGSSSGATLSTIYASQNPDRVIALALSALPLALPPPDDRDWRTDAILTVQRALFPNYMPRFYYDITLARLVGDPANLSEDEIQWYYETNNIPERSRRIGIYLAANMSKLWKSGATDAAGLVEKPILLQWGDNDPVLPAYLGDKAAQDFAKATVKLIHYSKVGHYPMFEIPEVMSRDITQWLSDIGVAAQPPP